MTSRESLSGCIASMLDMLTCTRSGGRGQHVSYRMESPKYRMESPKFPKLMLRRMEVDSEASFQQPKKGAAKAKSKTNGSGKTGRGKAALVGRVTVLSLSINAETGHSLTSRHRMRRRKRKRAVRPLRKPKRVLLQPVPGLQRRPRSEGRRRLRAGVRRKRS